MHGELASAVFALVMAAVVVTIAVGVNNARLAQMRAGSEGGEVLAAREATAGELRDVSGVRGIRLRGQQERRRRLSSTVLVVKLRAVSSQVEQRVLEGEGVAERGGLLLLLLGQRVGGGSHLAQLVQPQTPGHAGTPGSGRHAPSGTQLASEASSQAREPTVAAEAGNRGLGRVEHVPHRLQVRDAVHS